MKRRLLLGGVAALALVFVTTAYAAHRFHQVKPNEFDPYRTELVQAAWLDGVGCPTNARYFPYPSGPLTTYTDPACPVGDPRDRKNEGLLLFKTGPTDNFASAYAILKDPPSTVTELGYDIRKQGGNATPMGSHCGAGAPRFNIVLDDGTFIFGPGCNSPPAPIQTLGNGWTRMRWPVSYTNVDEIAILFDEGQDTAPDFFGGAILDNININGVRVGRGPTDSD